MATKSKRVKMEGQPGEINEEFEELKLRWDNFISRFKQLAPSIYKHKKNVFYEMVSDTRSRESFVEMSRSTRPFVAKQLWDLLEKFMEFMRNLPGIEGENYRAVYHEMTAAGLIKRLLTKRPIVFFKANDEHVLRMDPLARSYKKNKWNQLAMTLEKPKDDVTPYLREYISYDEILLSALVNMSTPTYFLSDGSVRSTNQESTKPFVQKGILCGLVGARLKKAGFMEHRFVFPRLGSDPSFNDVHHSDKFWIENVFGGAFPEGKIPTADEIKSRSDLYKNIYVDGANVVYLKKRLALSIIPFIEETACRGNELNKDVVAVVPPIGAGVWRGALSSKTIIDLIAQGILEYLDNDVDATVLGHLKAIFIPKTDSKIYSSFKPRVRIRTIEVSRSDASIEVTFINGNTLTIFNESRYVAQPLPEALSSCLVVAAYAWDGNSYPGNEYWIGGMGSFDPQAMLCSCLGQFQNPEVNVQLADPERIKFY